MADTGLLAEDNGSAVRPAPSEANEPEENIFLFYPNLIGYIRVILAAASLHYMPLHPRTCSLLYIVSCLLDALDGMAARYFDQGTKFGTVFDMVTDRCTTSCLLVFLAGAFPRWSFVFQGLISLDLSSHYMHMYATLSIGESGRSHKTVEKSHSWVLNMYYSNKKVLFTFCALNELFFIALYLLSFSSPYLSPTLFQTPDNPASLPLGTPAAPERSTLFTSPWSAGAMEHARANKMNSTVPWIMAVVSFPVMVGKQIINVIQLVKASRRLAKVDIEERRARALQKQE